MRRGEEKRGDEDEREKREQVMKIVSLKNTKKNAVASGKE